MVKYFAVAYKAENIAFSHKIFCFVLFLLTFDIFQVSTEVCACRYRWQPERQVLSSKRKLVNKWLLKFEGKERKTYRNL